MFASFKTQVDGAHDNEDTKFFDTPGSQQSASGPPSNQPPQSSGTNRSMAASDEDDDDDDDDFVAATPGFAPSSVHPHYPLQSRELTSRNGSQIDALPSETPLLSGPPTPMTPASVTPFGASTPSWKRPSVPVRDSVPPTPGRKRRRRSPSNVGDTDTDVDDYDDDDDESDIEDDVELITNATMTPAGHGADLEDEDEEPGSRNQRSPRHSRHLSTRNANVMPSSSRQLSSPGSQLGDVPPESQERSGGDSELLHGDEEDKEEEEDEEPLNSGDDVSDEEPEVLFESDNVVVCQYDKIQRSRNRWRFHLKDGIMVINGRDHVFQKAVGEAEW
ncbi:unnamed protein product [Dicrocoelium dendriticum]|nr:unnamed protein product [Dicrocoelium dendriticum]